MQTNRVVGGFALCLILFGYSAAFGKETRQLVFSPGASLRKDAAVEHELAVQAQEIKRLESLAGEKNKAIDVSIVEIKKFAQDKRRMLADNPFLAAAYDTDGWEKVQLDGLTDVSIKPSGATTIVRVPMIEKNAASKMLSASSRALFACNGLFCFVVPTSILGLAQTADSTGR